jgi:protein-S-isoprenylcysteine O-methyltransferase Ste14
LTEKPSILGGIFPPPLVVLALSIIGLGLQWHNPLLFQQAHRAYWVFFGIILVGTAGLLAFSARQIMRSQGTPIIFNKPTVVIVSKGPFAFTRNPLYLSLIMLYAGVGIMVNSLWFAPLLGVLVLFLHKVVLREENYLEHEFGKAYVLYKSAVRRWL